MASRDGIWTDNIDLSVESHQHDRESNASPSGGSINASQDPKLGLLGNNRGGLGKPSRKPILDWVDLLVLSTSLVCCVLAIATVAVDVIAWSLSTNHQIVVIGLLLGVMATCLKSVAPRLFLLCEIRFGASKVQNIDALRTNTATSSQVDWWWRGAMLLLIALPLGLDVLYKLFRGGFVSVRIGTGDAMYNRTFGINPPPRLLPLGFNTGLLLMSNATMPFLVASTNQSATSDVAQGETINDYQLPGPNQAYGYNILLIDSQTAAFLDSPPPSWVEDIQARIGINDTVEIEADVLATVTALDNTVKQHPSDTDPWWNYAAGDPPDANVSLVFPNYIWIHAKPPLDFDFTQASPLFIGLCKPPIVPTSIALMFNTTRRNCQGRWSVTQGAMRLTGGNCNLYNDTGALLNERSQLIFTNFNGLALTEYFPEVLAEILGPFAQKNVSVWMMPTMAVAVASMYWSRVAAAAGPSSPHWLGNDSFKNPLPDHQYEIVDNTSITYTSESTLIFWNRPALHKSPWLYLIICLPLAITAAMLLVMILMYHVAIGKGFGLVTVLAGVEQDSLAVLQGAGFSGELRRPVHLGVSVQEAGGSDGNTTLRYRLRESKPVSQGMITRRSMLF